MRGEIEKSELGIPDVMEMPEAPHPREMIDLEVGFLYNVLSVRFTVPKSEISISFHIILTNCCFLHHIDSLDVLSTVCSYSMLIDIFLFSQFLSKNLFSSLLHKR